MIYNDIAAIKLPWYDRNPVQRVEQFQRSLGDSTTTTLESLTPSAGKNMLLMGLSMWVNDQNTDLIKLWVGLGASASLSQSANYFYWIDYVSCTGQRPRALNLNIPVFYIPSGETYVFWARSEPEAYTNSIDAQYHLLMYEFDA